ncbi:double-stranded RNA-binding protein 6-like [Zingiber officinale]|uniref:DRBM domain-containing protein n=1 Tax=Zingiber officinale TaxID=94328 RepID=A0A8J5L1E4_ZINOF|nr:double-stranded RNA-binding protein 6-like [Zingiber officinale]KAG6503889.1 hypothetical protein ZIOFF_036213 [Zingiber officinale]
MYKNQLQELAQRSCFNLPSYTCIREGPDHAPRFKATVNFNGEVFESPSFCLTLRQAEHSAAEVALNALSHRGPSHSLAARILDETGVYKNLLQEIAQRVGAPLPSYTTVRSGLGHLPVFTCTVELAGIIFTGEPAKNKKQAEKNAALAAWSSLKQLAKVSASSSNEQTNNDEQEQITIARALLHYRLKEKMTMANNPNATPFPKKFPIQPDKRPSSLQPPSVSKILPLIRQKSAPRVRATSPGIKDVTRTSTYQQGEYQTFRPQHFPVRGAAPYFPVGHFNRSCHGMAPPVTIRTAVPVFSAPPLQPPASQVCPPPPPGIGHTQIRLASPVRIRQAVPVFAASPPIPPTTTVIASQSKEGTPALASSPLVKESVSANASGPPVQVKESMTSSKELSPVTTPDVPVLIKEPPLSVQIHDPSVVPIACPPKSSIPTKDTLDARDAKDLAESESTAMESLRRLEI